VILDKNALSDVADAEPGAVEAFSRAEIVAIPVIVLGEYRFGIARSRRRAEYERWLLESLLYCRVLTIDEETIFAYAAIRSELRDEGKPIPSNDVWIAALCRQHSLPLLSRDNHSDRVRGLQRVGW
jgi:predicted nucleic acid-binding protein